MYFVPCDVGIVRLVVTSCGHGSFVRNEHDTDFSRDGSGEQSLGSARAIRLTLPFSMGFLLLFVSLIKHVHLVCQGPLVLLSGRFDHSYPGRCLRSICCKCHGSICVLKEFVRRSLAVRGEADVSTCGLRKIRAPLSLLLVEGPIQL